MYKSSIHIRMPCLRKTPVIGSAFLGFSFSPILNGTDINLIQKLAGHSNVKTTMIYTHISHNHISKIQSPLSNIKI